jgi:hypothetical protein
MGSIFAAARIAAIATKPVDGRARRNARLRRKR